MSIVHHARTINAAATATHASRMAAATATHASSMAAPSSRANASVVYSELLAARSPPELLYVWQFDHWELVQSNATCPYCCGTLPVSDSAPPTGRTSANENVLQVWHDGAPRFAHLLCIPKCVSCEALMEDATRAYCESCD